MSVALKQNERSSAMHSILNASVYSKKIRMLAINKNESLRFQLTVYQAATFVNFDFIKLFFYDGSKVKMQIKAYETYI